MMLVTFAVCALLFALSLPLISTVARQQRARRRLAPIPVRKETALQARLRAAKEAQR